MSDDDRMCRLVPAVLRHPYAVFLGTGERLGLVDEPEQVRKLLDADPCAGVLVSRRGYVVLADLDAWLCLPRTFKLRDYLSQSTVVRCRTESGRLYYEIRRSGIRSPIATAGSFDSRRPGHRRPGARRPQRSTGPK